MALKKKQLYLTAVLVMETPLHRHPSLFYISPKPLTESPSHLSSDPD